MIKYMLKIVYLSLAVLNLYRCCIILVSQFKCMVFSEELNLGLNIPKNTGLLLLYEPPLCDIKLFLT